MSRREDGELDTPPGLNYMNLTFLGSGGDDKPWLPFTKIKYYTNAFIVQDGKVLLGFKKRGFGAGKYNGFGGKVDPGETPIQAAVRELREEAGIEAPLEHAGSLLFFSDGAEWAFQIEIYRAETYEGTVTESDEMRPEWFSSPSSNIIEQIGEDTPPIPFSQMWETDHIWLPLLINKQKFVGRADFAASQANGHSEEEGTEKKLLPYRWWFAIAPNDP